MNLVLLFGLLYGTLYYSLTEQLNFYKSLAQIKYVTIAVSSQSVQSMRRTYHAFTIPDGYIPIGSHYVGTDDNTMSSIICGNVARIFNTDLNTHTANGTIYVALAPYSAS